MNKSVPIILHKAINAVDVFMIRLLPSSIFRTKKVHISFDDVHNSFKMAIDKQYQSIFEIPFFNSLKELNSKYGVKLSLYIFQDPSLTYPKKILDELHRACDWLSVGYHADIDGNTSVKSFDSFFNTFGKIGCVSDKTRLHRFTAALEVIEELKDSGIKELFCADDTRDSYGIPDSVFLSGGVSNGKVSFIQRQIFDWNIFASLN